MSGSIDEYKKHIDSEAAKGRLFETSWGDPKEVLQEGSYLLHGFEDKTVEESFDDDTVYTKDVSPLYRHAVMEEPNNKGILDIVLNEVPYYHIGPSEGSDALESVLSDTRDAGYVSVPSVLNANPFYQTWFRDAFGYVQNELLLDVYNKLRYPYLNENQYLDARVFVSLAKEAFSTADKEDAELRFSEDDAYIQDIIEQKVLSGYSFIDYTAEQSNFLTTLLESLYESGRMSEEDIRSERLVFRLQEMKNELLRRKLSGTHSLYKLALASLNASGSFVGVAKAKDISVYDTVTTDGSGNTTTVRKSHNENRPVRVLNIPGITSSRVDVSSGEHIDPIASFYETPDDDEKMPLSILVPLYYTSSDVKDTDKYTGGLSYNTADFYCKGHTADGNVGEYVPVTESLQAYRSWFLRDNSNVIPWGNLEGVLIQKSLIDYPDTLDMYVTAKDTVDPEPRTLDSVLDDGTLWYLDSVYSAVNLNSVYANVLDVSVKDLFYHKNSIQTKIGANYEYLTYPIASGNGVCLCDLFWLNYMESQLQNKVKVNDSTLYGVQVSKYADIGVGRTVEYSFFGKSFSSEMESYSAGDPQTYMLLWYCTLYYNAVTFEVTDFKKTLISRVTLKQAVPADLRESDGSLKEEYSDYQQFIDYNIGIIPFTYKGLVDEKITALRLGFYPEDGKTVPYDDAEAQGYRKAMFVFSESDAVKLAPGQNVDPKGLSDDGLFTQKVSPGVRTVFYVIERPKTVQYLNTSSVSSAPVYDDKGNLVVEERESEYLWSDPIRVFDMDSLDVDNLKDKTFTPDWYGLAYHLNPYLNFTPQSASPLRHKDVAKAESVFCYDTGLTADQKKGFQTEGPSPITALSNLVRVRHLDFAANDFGEASPTVWAGEFSEAAKKLSGLYLEKHQPLRIENRSLKIKETSKIFGDNRGLDIFEVTANAIDYRTEGITSDEADSDTLYVCANNGSVSYEMKSGTKLLNVGNTISRERSSIYYDDLLSLPALSIQKDLSTSSRIEDNYLRIVPGLKPENYNSWYWNSLSDGFTVCMDLRLHEFENYTQASGLYTAGVEYYEKKKDSSGFSPKTVDPSLIGTAIEDGVYTASADKEAKTIVRREGEFSLEIRPIDKENASEIVFSYYPTAEGALSWEIASGKLTSEELFGKNLRISASLLVKSSENGGSNVQLSLLVNDDISETQSIDLSVDGGCSIDGFTGLSESGNFTSYKDQDGYIPGMPLKSFAGNPNPIILFSKGIEEKTDGNLYCDVFDLRLYNKGKTTLELRFLNAGSMREMFSYSPSSYKLAYSLYRDLGFLKVANLRNDDAKTYSVGAVRVFNRSIWDSVMVDPYPVSKEEMDPDSPQYNAGYRNPLDDTDVYNDGKLSDCVEQTLIDKVEALNGRQLRQTTQLYYDGEYYTLGGETSLTTVTSLVTPVNYDDEPLPEDDELTFAIHSNGDKNIAVGSKSINITASLDSSDDYVKYSADLTPNFTMDSGFDLSSWLTRGENVTLEYDDHNGKTYLTLSDDSLKDSNSNFVVVPFCIPAPGETDQDKNVRLDRFTVSDFRLSKAFTDMLRATTYYSELRIPMPCSVKGDGKVPAEVTVGTAIPVYYVNENGGYTPAMGLFVPDKKYYTVGTDGSYSEYVPDKYQTEIPAYYTVDLGTGDYTRCEGGTFEAGKVYYKDGEVYSPAYYNKWDGLRVYREGTYYFTSKYPMMLLPFNDAEWDSSEKGNYAVVYGSTRFKIEVSSEVQGLTVKDDSDKYGISGIPKKYWKANIVNTLSDISELQDPADNCTFPHRKIYIDLYALDNEGIADNDSKAFEWTLIASNRDAYSNGHSPVTYLSKEALDGGCRISKSVPMFLAKNFSMPFFVAGRTSTGGMDSTEAAPDLVAPISIETDTEKSDRITASSEDGMDSLCLKAGKTYKILFDYTSNISECSYTNETYSEKPFNTEKTNFSRCYSVFDSLGILSSDYMYTTNGDSYDLGSAYMDYDSGFETSGTGFSNKDINPHNRKYTFGNPYSKTSEGNALYGLLKSNTAYSRGNIDNSYTVPYMSVIGNDIVSALNSDQKPTLRSKVTDFLAYGSSEGDVVTVGGFKETAVVKTLYNAVVGSRNLQNLQLSAMGLFSGLTKMIPVFKVPSGNSKSYEVKIKPTTHKLYSYQASSRTVPYSSGFSISRTSLYRNNLIKGVQLDLQNTDYWTITGDYGEISSASDTTFGKFVTKITDAHEVVLSFDGGDYSLTANYEIAINVKTESPDQISGIKAQLYDKDYSSVGEVDLTYGDGDKNADTGICTYHKQVGKTISASRVVFTVTTNAHSGVTLYIGKAVVRGSGTTTQEVGLANTLYRKSYSDNRVLVPSHLIPVFKDVSTEQYLPIQFKNRLMNAYSMSRPFSGVNRAMTFINDNMLRERDGDSRICELHAPWIRRMYILNPYVGGAVKVYFHDYRVAKDSLGQATVKEGNADVTDLFRLSGDCIVSESTSTGFRFNIGSAADLTGLELDLDDDGTLQMYGNNLKVAPHDAISLQDVTLSMIYNCFDVDAVRQGSSSPVAVTNIQLLKIEPSADQQDTSDREVLYELEYLPIIYDETKHHLSMNIMLKE